MNTTDNLAKRVRVLIPFLKLKQVRKVLQFAGSPESVAIFCNEGFEVSVAAESERLDEIRSHLSSKDYAVEYIELKLQKSGKLSGLPDKAFDFLLAYNEVYKYLLEDMKARLSSLIAALREDGFFYITFISTKHKDFQKGEEIASDTFKFNDQIRFFCDAAFLVPFFKHLEVIDLRNEEQDVEKSFHWHVLGRKRDMNPE